MGTSVTTTRSGSATRAAITRVGLVVFVALNAMSETVKFYNRDATSATAAAMGTRGRARVETVSARVRDEPAAVRRALERSAVNERQTTTTKSGERDEEKTTTTTTSVEAEEKTTTMRGGNASTVEAAS
jgi:hypothetical protein